MVARAPQQQEGRSTLQTAEWALLISLVSLIIAALSLSWQIFTWTRQSARIIVIAEWGAVSKDGKNTVSVDSAADFSTAYELIDKTEYPEAVVKITARNTGRAPMSIQDVYAIFPDGATYRDRARSLADGIPKTLQPGEAVHVTIPALSLYHAWSTQTTDPKETTICGGAQLANGKKVKSNNLTMRYP